MSCDFKGRFGNVLLSGHNGKTSLDDYSVMAASPLANLACHNRMVRRNPYHPDSICLILGWW